MEGCFTVAVSLFDLSLQEKGCRADAFYQFFLLLCLLFLCFPLFASRFLFDFSDCPVRSPRSFFHSADADDVHVCVSFGQSAKFKGGGIVGVCRADLVAGIAKAFPVPPVLVPNPFLFVVYQPAPCLFFGAGFAENGEHYLTASFSGLPGRNFGFLVAGMVSVSPVCGLRP